MAIRLSRVISNGIEILEEKTRYKKSPFFRNMNTAVKGITRHTLGSGIRDGSFVSSSP